MRLKEKRAFITGAGSGIGRAIALEFAREGADVACHDINLHNAGNTAGQVAQLGRRAVAVKSDIGDFNSTRTAAQEAETKLGSIDILVHAAGIAPMSAFVDTSYEDWDRVQKVHLYGLFNISRVLIKGMIGRKWGRIITISSLSGTSGDPMFVHYSAAKAGMLGFVKALAKETAADGVTVNAVAPGITRTPALENADPELMQTLMPPRGKFAEPEDQAWACLYLASEEARHVTGQVISPNGGYWT